MEVSRVGGDLRVQAMDSALHLSRHGPLLKLQLSRVHHRATHDTENRYYRYMICKTFKSVGVFFLTLGLTTPQAKGNPDFVTVTENKTHYDQSRYSFDWVFIDIGQF